MTTIYQITRKGKQSIKRQDPSAKIRLGWSIPCPDCTGVNRPSITNPPIILEQKLKPIGSGLPAILQGTCKTCGSIVQIKED